MARSRAAAAAIASPLPVSASMSPACSSVDAGGNDVRCAPWDNATTVAPVLPRSASSASVFPSASLPAATSSGTMVPIPGSSVRTTSNVPVSAWLPCLASTCTTSSAPARA